MITHPTAAVEIAVVAYGAWGALITIFGLITGSIIDNWGVAKCLRLGFTISFISRLTLLLTTSKTVLLVCLLFTLPLGNCLGIPVLTVGVRRYTTKANRGFAFGLFYVIMNLGALVAGPLVDTLTFHYNNNAKTSNEDDSDDSGGNNSTTTIDDGSIIDINDEEQITAAWKMTISRAIIMSGVCTSFIAVLIAFTIREIKVESEDDDSCDYSKQETNDFSASMDADMHNDDSNSINNDSDKNNDDDVCPNDRDENKNMVSKKVINNTSNSSITEFQPRKGSPFQIISETIRTPNFRRFLLLTLLTINVKMVFRHL
jgi:MFS family permease